MRIDPGLINVRPHPTDPHARWVCYGDAGMLIALCDDWNDPALAARSMHRMDEIIQSLVDRMSAHQKVALRAAAEGKSIG